MIGEAARQPLTRAYDLLFGRHILKGLLAAALAVAVLCPVEVPNSVSSDTDKLVHLAASVLLVPPVCTSISVTGNFPGFSMR